VALVAAATVGSSLVGCSQADSGGSGSGDSAGGKPSLLLWVDTPRVPAAEMYKEKMAGEQDIKIEVIAQADAQTKIALANRTKKGWPDIIFGTAADTAQFLDPSNGYAANLDELVDEEILDGFGEGNSDCVFDGKTYCLKNDLANIVLWYDTKTFEELGLTVPTTMQEFAATAMKLKGTGYSAGASATRATTPTSCSPASARWPRSSRRTSCASRRRTRSARASRSSCSRCSTPGSSTAAPASTRASSRTSPRRARSR
jgi:multiple sugar transport system substrate-binding protein